MLVDDEVLDGPTRCGLGGRRSVRLWPWMGNGA